MVGARCKLANVRKIEILRYQEPLSGLTRRPDCVIRVARKSFPRSSISVVPKTGQLGNEVDRKILVELYSHEARGRGCIGRSSSAEAAAKAMTARTSASVSVGKARSMSSALSP
jgi:hypothetical protein